VLTIQEWRDDLVPKEISVVPLPETVRKSGIFARFFGRQQVLYTAGCGHGSPRAYVITADGKEVEISEDEMSARCPDCAVTQTRLSFIEGLALAVACVGCGSPIFPGQMIGACISVGKEPEFPPTLTEDGLMVICSSSACMAVVIYGYWDGEKAVRLTCEQLEEMGVISVLRDEDRVPA